MSIFEHEGKIYDAKKLHTKQLLNWLDRARSTSEWEYEAEWGEIVPIIKKELSTREHVPNRFEAKEIRKQKSIQKKNKKNKKYRNHR